MNSHERSWGAGVFKTGGFFILKELRRKHIGRERHAIASRASRDLSKHIGRVSLAPVSLQRSGQSSSNVYQTVKRGRTQTNVGGRWRSEEGRQMTVVGLWSSSGVVGERNVFKRSWWTPGERSRRWTVVRGRRGLGWKRRRAHGERWKPSERPPNAPQASSYIHNVPVPFLLCSASFYM